MTAQPTGKITVSWHSDISHTRVSEKCDTEKGAAGLVEVLKTQPGLRASEIRVNGKEER